MIENDVDLWKSYFISVVKHERGASSCPRLINLGKAENIEVYKCVCVHNQTVWDNRSRDRFISLRKNPNVVLVTDRLQYKREPTDGNKMQKKIDSCGI